MSEVATVAIGWGLTFVVIVTYSLWVVSRGRTIGRKIGIGEVHQSGQLQESDCHWIPSHGFNAPTRIEELKKFAGQFIDAADGILVIAACNCRTGVQVTAQGLSTGFVFPKRRQKQLNSALSWALVAFELGRVIPSSARRAESQRSNCSRVRSQRSVTPVTHLNCLNSLDSGGHRSRWS